MHRPLSSCWFPAFLALVSFAGAADRPSTPQPVEAEDFAELKETSPFLRVLQMDDVYVLRGVAKIGDEIFAVLHDKKNKETITVSSEDKNDQGMSLVAVSGSTPKDMAVTISMGGGQFKFAYEAEQLQPKIVVPGMRDTIRRDREGRVVTSNELIEKWKLLTPEQRKAYEEWRQRLLQARPDLQYSEKRFPLAHQALDALKEGRQPPAIR